MSEEATPQVNTTESISTAPQSTAPAKASAPVDLNSIISEDIRAQGNIKDFKDADSLAKSYLELQKMVGGSVRIPPADASPEAKSDFLNKIKDIDGVLIKDSPDLYTKLGRPDTKDGYDLSTVVTPEVAKALPQLKEELESFRDVAHEIGLTTAQVNKLAEMRLSAYNSTLENEAAIRQNAQEQLKKIWGADYDNQLNATKTLANLYKDKYGDSMQSLINSPAGNNPALLAIMAELAAAYKEKGHAGMQQVEMGMTPELARYKISEKKSDRGFMEAYLDAKHPGHDQAVQTMTDLRHISSGL